jgi:hypothetical protein
MLGNGENARVDLRQRKAIQVGGIDDERASIFAQTGEEFLANIERWRVVRGAFIRLWKRYRNGFHRFKVGHVRFPLALRLMYWGFSRLERI